MLISYLLLQDVVWSIGTEQWKESIVQIKRFMFPQKGIIFLKLLNNTFAITNDYNLAHNHSQKRLKIT